jgi:hypothetical protein
MSVTAAALGAPNINTGERDKVGGRPGARQSAELQFSTYVPT